MIFMKLKAVIDRLEEDKAILLLQDDDDEIEVVWPRKLLPKAKEGLFLNITIEADKNSTQKALSENEQLLQQILAQQKRD
jgi:hypothetical protein